MSSPPAPPDGPSSADDMLPPVQPPAAGFILQLFLIPLIIVAIIVAIWLMFSWLAHMGNDPQDLVRDLRHMDGDSWRKAYALSNVLRNPENDALKDDAELCRELASALSAQTAAGSSEADRVRFRVFLCKALGEFRVVEGLPALVEAAARTGSQAELDVQYAAIESIAVLAHNVGPETIRSDADAMTVLLAASRQPGDREPAGRKGALRSTAAFALGVIGGQEATSRLTRMLNDVRPNVRYNAATGLARHGDIHALPVLLEMLDPDNDTALKDEKTDSAREAKRLLVLTTGIRAATQLATQNPSANVTKLTTAVENLSRSPHLSGRVHTDAKEALVQLRNVKESGMAP